jgi:Arylsulfotransferase (ASST)
MKVAFATCAALPDGWSDGHPVAALVGAEYRVWDDETVDWAAYDRVVLRSVWDYTDRVDEFLGWCAAVGPDRLRNTPSVVTFNADKRYLAELSAPSVPTMFVAPGGENPAVEGRVVVKPNVSAGGLNTGRFSTPRHSAAVERIKRICATGRVGAGSAVPVDDRGGWGDRGGVHRRATLPILNKRPVPRSSGVAPIVQDPLPVAAVMLEDELVTVGTADEPQIALARVVHDALCGRFVVPLFARVDVIQGPDGAPALLEACPHLNGTPVGVLSCVPERDLNTMPVFAVVRRELVRFLSVIVVGLVAFVPAVAVRASGTATTDAFTQSFHSAPALHPPIVSVRGRDPDPRYGDIFTDASNTVQPGPIILSPQGQLIWFSPIPGGRFACDVEVQRYEGQSVLTYWQGYGGALPAGQDVIVNHFYQTIAVVHAGTGYLTDTHEFTITPQGTALISAYQIIPANLTSVGGPAKGKLVDSTIQEIDIATGQVLWQWQAYGHVPLTDSYAGKPGKSPYDFFHLNSIQQLPNGNLLVSARHTWTVYEISKQTGAILWELGGKQSSFKFGPGAHFEWQHDARMEPDGTITLLDNGAGAGPQHQSQSRALRLRLNFKTHRVTVAKAYTNDPSLLSSSQGDVQILPDGNVLVGWGAVPNVTEFSSGGRQVFSVYFHAPVQSYRALRSHWSGQPTAPPAIAVRAVHKGTRVYASWNGATGVASWLVLAGPSPSGLKPVKDFPKTSFETEMTVPSTKPYFAVQALGSAGHVLSASATVQR